ncbi:MAG: DnaJ domain-containing protein [Methyloligella sp. ZOD6]
MYAFLIGLGIFLIVLFGARYLANADTSKLARAIRKYSWIALFILAGLFIIPGLLILAIPLAIVGYTMLRRQGIRFRTFGTGPFGPGGMGGLGGAYGPRQRRPGGQKSFVRTAHLEMELDHGTGRVDGRVVAGQFAGRALSDLDMRELQALVAALQQGDPQEAALIEAYLNQRAPGWQEGAGPSGAGNGTGGTGRRRTRASSSMSVDEAYEVLGVSRSASVEEIRVAHRQLMKRVHPDQGGSTYLAARINEAKEVLLSVR